MPPIATEDVPSAPLVGTKDNPARDPRKRPVTGKGSIGDVALRDGIMIIALCLAFLLFLAYSLRHHNI